MDLEFTDELRDFQREVRAFIEERLPGDLREKVERSLKLSKEDYLRWQDVLAGKGWLAYSWPVEYGGPDWSPMQCYIFQEELGRANAPRIIPFGPKMVGPVIYTFGNDAQKAKYLPDIANNKTWWCQGYSEPDAGSDLASLRTRAVRDGDCYVVNGTKTWTTLAQWADMMFCLVRTDPEARQQEGISFLLIDMRAPGVEVRPIATIDGGQEINTVYLTDVKAPVEDRIGEENRGWTYAKFLLGHERFGIAGIAASKARLSYLKDVARRHRVGGALLAEDADFMRAVAETEIELTALEYTELRALTSAEQGESPGVEAEHPQDPWHRRAAEDLRDAHEGRGLLRRALSPRGDGTRLERGAGRAGVRGAARPGVLRHAQDVDLRRHQRDTAQHHRQDGAGAVIRSGGAGRGPAYRSGRRWRRCAVRSER